MDSVHYSSTTDLWATPQEFFDKYNSMYNFTLDVCASHSNAKCSKYFTLEDDGLGQTWSGVCWMNPPYGDPEHACKPNCKKKTCALRGHHNLSYKPGIGDWMRKAYESSLQGATVVCLVPSRTDTKWWHEYAMKGDITFIKGRLKFGDAKNSAPFPSAVILFRGM
jgi:phage N-6-adenine-methyltransferase